MKKTYLRFWRIKYNTSIDVVDIESPEKEKISLMKTYPDTQELRYFELKEVKI